MGTVSLGQLRFRLSTAEQHAESVQQRCSDWFHEQFQASLTSLLEVVDSTGQVVRIDRLLLDVGEIPLDRFETEMSKRVLAELTRRLRAYGNSTAHNDRSVSADAGARAAMSDSTKPTSENAVRDGLAQLLFYLDIGYIDDPTPWRGQLDRDHWLTSLLDQLPNAAATIPSLPPRVEFALRCLRPRALQRLATTFSTSALAALTAWLIAPTDLPLPAWPDWSTWLPLGALLALRRFPASLYNTRLPAGARSFPHQEGSSASARLPGPAARDEGARVNHDAVQAAWNTAKTRTTSRDMGFAAQSSNRQDRSMAAPDPTLDAWLDALLREPLPEPLRAQLRSWLTESLARHGTASRLTALSFHVRRRLHAVLGLQLPRPILHRSTDKTQSSSPPADTHPPRDATQARVHEHPALNPASRATSQSQAQAQAQARSASLSTLADPHARRDTTEGPAPDQRPVPSASRTTSVEHEEPLPVCGSGLVLLWPLLPRLFESLALVDADKQWLPDAQRRAVALLDWLAWGDACCADWRLPVPRLLCGLPPLPDDAEPIDWPALDVPQQAYLDSWLGATLVLLPGLQRLSVTDLRALFLQRPGALDHSRGDWHLSVEPEAQDVLLHTLPWPLTIVTLPWLSTPLPVNWISS